MLVPCCCRWPDNQRFSGCWRQPDYSQCTRPHSSPPLYLLPFTFYQHHLPTPSKSLPPTPSDGVWQSKKHRERVIELYLKPWFNAIMLILINSVYKQMYFIYKPSSILLSGCSSRYFHIIFINNVMRSWQCPPVLAHFISYLIKKDKRTNTELK